MRIKSLAALPLLFPLITPLPTQAQTISGVPHNTVESYLIHPKSSFPDMGINYIHTVVEPAKAAAEKAEADRVAAEQAAQAAAYVPVVTYTYYAPKAFTGGLTGSIGYSLAGGNCVDTARAYGKVQPGNPISWYTTTNRPFIGAAALFPFNHVAIVVGIWSNGDIEVAQQNAPGAPHRYSQSEIRGYF